MSLDERVLRRGSGARVAGGAIDVEPEVGT